VSTISVKQLAVASFYLNDYLSKSLKAAFLAYTMFTANVNISYQLLHINSNVSYILSDNQKLITNKLRKRII